MTLFEYAERLKLASNEQQMRAVLVAYLVSFGIRSFAFTYYSGHVKSGRKLIYDCVSTELQDWHHYYLAQQYADVDRTLEENHTMTLPLFWDVKKQLEHAKNKREKRIREESIEYGIDLGLSIPVHGPNDDFVTLTLHQRKGESGLNGYENKQYEWLSACHLFFHYLKSIIIIELPVSTINPLTKREEQCLLLTAKGWRVNLIAKELNISPRTVNFHIQNANKKFGTNNKYFAIYKYMRSLK